MRSPPNGGNSAVRPEDGAGGGVALEAREGGEKADSPWNKQP